MGKLLPALALCVVSLLGSAKQANAELNLGLFPKQPLYRTVMVDPDILKTEIKVPQGLEKELLEKPTGELLPYISLGKTLPLLSLDISRGKTLSIIPAEVKERARLGGRTLSKKILSASLVAGGQLAFPKGGEEIDYKTRLELFLNSPMIDDYSSDGNRLYIVGGFTGQGSTKSKELVNQNISQIFESFIDKYSFSGDIYIVPKSPYSDQYLILRVGVDNLFGNTLEKPNVNISTTWEFPPLLHWLKMFENFKLSPYLSTHVQIPTDSEKPITASGQLGIKAGGQSDNSLFLYTQANYNQQDPWTFFTGLKAEF